MTSHGAAVRPPGARAAGDGGFALIEILVSVVILGIAFVAILGGMATSIRMTELHRQQAEVQAVLVSAVERLKSSEATPQPCADGRSYLAIAQEAAKAEDWDVSTVTITDVAYWDGTNYVADCDAALRSQPGDLLSLQRITVEVAHPQGNVTSDLELVKDAFIPAVGTTP